MGKRGRPPGCEKTGGRTQGTPNKSTARKAALLASPAEQFKAEDYDPLVEMRKLATKERLGKNDGLRFSMHQALAKKFYPDVSAVKVSGDPENPLLLSPEERQARLQALQARLHASSNGHGPPVKDSA